jgi:hypothetical protein
LDGGATLLFPAPLLFLLPLPLDTGGGGYPHYSPLPNLGDKLKLKTVFKTLFSAPNIIKLAILPPGGSSEVLVLVDSFLSLETSVWYVHTVQLARFKAQLAGVSKQRIKHLHYYVYIMEICVLKQYSLRQLSSYNKRELFIIV